MPLHIFRIQPLALPTRVSLALASHLDWASAAADETSAQHAGTSLFTPGTRFWNFFVDSRSCCLTLLKMMTSSDLCSVRGNTKQWFRRSAGRSHLVVLNLSWILSISLRLSLTRRSLSDRKSERSWSYSAVSDSVRCRASTSQEKRSTRAPGSGSMKLMAAMMQIRGPVPHRYLPGENRGFWRQCKLVPSLTGNDNEKGGRSG